MSKKMKIFAFFIGLAVVVAILLLIAFVMFIFHLNMTFELKEDGTYELTSYDNSSIAGTFNIKESLRIPDKHSGVAVTSIGESAFYKCTLKSIIIPDSITNIGKAAFMECNKLQSVTIGNGVISIGTAAFSECDNLISIDIPDSVTTIGERAFAGCGPSVEWAFNNCDGLQSVTIGSGITTIEEGAFEDCQKLTSVTFSENGTEPLIINKNAFRDCTNLTTLTIPNNITYIESTAFEGCNTLAFNESDAELLYLGNTQNPYAVLMGVKNTAKSNYEISINTKCIYSYAFKDCTLAQSITVPIGVRSISDRAFFNCSQLSTITIPSSITEIGVNAFSDCAATSLVYQGSRSDWMKITKRSLNGFTVFCTDGPIEYK